MKTARSEGGPFIIMDSTLAPSWGGVMHKGFMDETYDGVSDYDSLCAMLNFPEYARKGIVRVQSKNGQALLLEMPFEATILFNDPDRACIVQAHYSDPEWSAEVLDRSVLDFVSQQDSNFAEMRFNGDRLVVFDSTCDYNKSRVEIPCINLINGIIHANYSIHHSDERTMISVADFQVR